MWTQPEKRTTDGKKRLMEWRPRDEQKPQKSPKQRCKDYIVKSGDMKWMSLALSGDLLKRPSHLKRQGVLTLRMIMTIMNNIMSLTLKQKVREDCFGLVL